MVLKNHPLSGEDRRIVSTRLYQSEFLYLKRLCEKENKTINAKLREMVREEIERNGKQSNKIKLLREKEGIDEDYQKTLESMKSKNFEIKSLEKEWRKKKN